jgi:hypothetical protein
MYDCNKLYCKIDNLLNIVIKDREYYFKDEF